MPSSMKLSRERTFELPLRILNHCRHQKGDVSADPAITMVLKIEDDTPEKSTKGQIRKDISIIILDNEFNKIGEDNIENAGRDHRYNTFVAPLGLMIPKDTTEDFLAYRVYLPKSKQNH